MEEANFCSLAGDSSEVRYGNQGDILVGAQFLSRQGGRQDHPHKDRGKDYEVFS
jgi:hypothetical protein